MSITTRLFVVLSLVFVFSSVNVFAQGAPVATAASTDAVFTSLSPMTLVSDAKVGITKTLTIRGRNLKGLASVTFQDKDGNEYTAVAADNSSNTVLQVRFELDANENAVHTLAGTNLSLRVYDPEANTLRVNAAAGAAANREVANLKKQLEAQKTVASTTAEKIAVYEKQLGELSANQTTVNSQSATQLTDANAKIVALEKQIAALETTVKAQGTQLAQVRTEITSIDDFAQATALGISGLSQVDTLKRSQRKPAKAETNRAVLAAIAKRNTDRIATANANANNR